MTIKLPIERDGEEIIATVTLYHEPACRGRLDRIVGFGDGPATEPEQPELLEFDDSDIELTESEKERAVEMGWKEIYD